MSFSTDSSAKIRVFSCSWNGLLSKRENGRMNGYRIFERSLDFYVKFFYNFFAN